jgi:transposase
MVITKKKKRGKNYYYLVETGRVNGRAKIVWQKYLGAAERILRIVETHPERSIHSKVFGSIAAMLNIAEELQFEKIISKVVVDNNYKLTIWQHLLMQSICRFHGPMSKKKSVKWFRDSILSMFWGKCFSSPQTIFNQFDRIISENHNYIPLIEEELCRVLLSKGIRPSVLIWDPTNFFTYIEKGEDLPQKGQSKEKRYDKNIINLGLVVSEENIPLLHTVYDGNKHESKVVTEVVDTIYARLQKLGEKADQMVFVFDRGNNSKTNITHIDGKLHFIGALKNNQMKHLYEVELKEFDNLYTNKKGHVIKGYRTTGKLYGNEYSFIVTYNEKTRKKQELRTKGAIKRIKGKFRELEKSINNRKRGRKATTKGTAQRVGKFLYTQYQALFSWDFDEKKQRFTWKHKEAPLGEREKAYGKTVLFTDLDEWDAGRIASTYNHKSVVEDDFKVLKNRLLISITPVNSRKDPRIRAHVFVCVIGMILYRYMLWKLKGLGLTDDKINEEIRSMRLAFVKQKGSNSVKTVLETMSREQMAIYSLLNLERYIPN